MRMMWIGLLGLAALIAVALSLDWGALAHWALDQQRAFQTQMAGGVRALKAGEPGAYLALFAATGAYGFVHALGPGHGKYLVGGVGLGSSVSATRLVGIASASSLVQALWAIALVYGGFALVSLTAQQMTYLAEDILAPASYLAIAAVGLILVWRGVRQIRKDRAQTHHHHHDHHHDEDCGCGAHGPTAREIANVSSLREAIALITSVAIRPCTGAIFLLVIAWQMDLHMAGALAVIVMGLGTAALTSLVALSSVTARKLALVTAAPSGLHTTVFSASRVCVGVAIIWLSLGLLSVAL
ncbi:MAG: hypothetical protein AAFY25_14595 [Pseudomonadota bacterium]